MAEEEIIKEYFEEEKKLPEEPEIKYPKNRKYLNNDNINQESYLLEIISQCSPKMLG